MKKTSIVMRAIVYGLLGLYIFFAGEKAVGCLHIVIGLVIFIESLEEFIYELVKKSFLEHEHTLYHPLAFMIIAAVIFFSGDNSIGYLCIIWGVVAIVDSCKELNEALYQKAKGIHALKFVRSIIAIVFAVLLVIDPFEHVKFHMYLLAVEYMLECILMFDRVAEGRIEG